MALVTAPSNPASRTAYVESFTGRLRDECLNEHWFTAPATRGRHRTWRREYTEERQKRHGRTDTERLRGQLASTTIQPGL
jgi:hypothetical protein